MGHCLVWDVTIVNTKAASYLTATSTEAGSATELAASRKEVKYQDLTERYVFVPIAIESLGPLGSKATSFLSELGRRITAATFDVQETSSLYQRISIALQRFNAICMTLSLITNVNITDEQWRQASLPVKTGGIGVRSVMSIAPSAFLSSSTSTQQLQTLLLDKCAWQLSDQHFNNVLDDWCQRHYPVQPPTGTNASKQRSWDMPSVDATFNSLFAAQPDDSHRARLTAVKAPHSGDWLNALPITSCGLRLEDDAIRVAVGLRLGASLCEPHQCTCGNMVNTRGNHGLSCKRSAGRTLRHNYINDLVYHALLQAGLPSTK